MAKQDPDARERFLNKRDIVTLFQATGILEHTAKEMFRLCPEMLGQLKEKHAEDFRVVLRDVANILEREGVPKRFEKSMLAEAAAQSQEGVEGAVFHRKTLLCKICKDNAAIRCSHPARMKSYFQHEQEFRGRLTSNDWLCKSCYGDFYRENKDWLKQQQQLGPHSVEQDKDTNGEETEEEADMRSPKKELYIQTIVPLLYRVIVNLSPKAISHRKMLVRYITLNQIQLNQLPSALLYLRKLGNKIVDQEEFEKTCGLGKYSDLFGYSSWSEKSTQIEILHIGEQEKTRNKADKRLQQESKEREQKQQEHEVLHEQQRQQQLALQLKQATQAAEESVRLEKWKKLALARQKEDEELQQQRFKLDQSKEKQGIKHEQDLRNRKRERDISSRSAEAEIKKKEEELHNKREERFYTQRIEQEQRAANRRTNIKQLELNIS